MGNTVGIIFLITIFSFIIGWVFLTKCDSENKPSIIKRLKSSSILVKILFSIGVLYMFSFPVQAYMILKNEPLNLQYGSTRYHDIIDVNDGIIVVGSQQDEHVNKGTIRKFSYEGKMLWETIYNKSQKERSNFSNIEITSNGDYLVYGIAGTGDYDSELQKVFLTYNKDGKLINEQRFSDLYSVHMLNDDKYIDIKYDHYSEFENIIFTKYDLAGNELNKTSYEYKNTIESNYVLVHSVNVVGETNDRIFISIKINQVHQDIKLEERLLEFDKDLNLINEYTFIDGKDILKIMEIDNNYYITWNSQERKSFLCKYNDSMELVLEKEIIGNTPYTEINDMVYQNDHLYLVGEQYNNQSQVGFTDDYSGLVIDYNLKTNKINSGDLEKGLGISSAIIREGKIYGVGTFDTNSYYLSNSRYKGYPNMGLLSEIDLENFKSKIIDVL